MSELAAEVSRASGNDVEYRDLPADEYAKLLAGAGVPEEFAAVLARGDGEVTSDDLRTLIGRAPTTLAEAVAAAV